jgi:hypothetical protein
MKRLLTILYSLSIIILICKPAHAQCVDWDGIKETYDTYIKDPSSLNAGKLIGILPDDLSMEDRRNPKWGKTLDYIFEHEKFILLENLIKDGDENAINVIFKLKTITDGSSALHTDTVIGSIIIPHTKLFLKTLKNNRRYVHRLDVILLSTGPKLVDKFDEQSALLRKRYLALKAVKDKSLLLIRDECLTYFIEYED